MKGKHLALLLGLTLVLGGVWYLVAQRNQGGWSESGGGGGKVLEFPINDVAQIALKAPDGELHLVKKGDAWTVAERADYPASFEQVSSFLRKLWDLKTVQELKVGASQLPRLELAEPAAGGKAGTSVQLLGADGKPLAALLLGKKHFRQMEGGENEFGMPSEGVATGRYVKPAESPKVSLVSETFESAEVKPERWLDKEFIKIEGLKKITVAGPTPAQQWSVSRENTTAEWKLAEAKPDEKLDTGKTSSLGSSFSAPAFADVLAPDAKLAEIGLEKPSLLTLETFDGFRYELKIGQASGDNYPVLIGITAELPKERTAAADEKPEDKTRLDEQFAAKQKELQEKLAKEKKVEGRAYLLSKFTVESLLKDRSTLMADKPAAPAAGENGAPAPGENGAPAGGGPHSGGPLSGGAPFAPPMDVAPPVMTPPVAPAAPAAPADAPGGPAATSTPPPSATLEAESPAPSAPQTSPPSPVPSAPAPASP